MTLIAYILGLLALAIALIPSFGITQMAGLVLATFGLMLAIFSRKRASYYKRSTKFATFAIALSILALLASISVFSVCLTVQHNLNDQLNPAKLKVKD